MSRMWPLTSERVLLVVATNISDTFLLEFLYGGSNQMKG